MRGGLTPAKHARQSRRNRITLVPQRARAHNSAHNLARPKEAKEAEAAASEDPADGERGRVVAAGPAAHEAGGASVARLAAAVWLCARRMAWAIWRLSELIEVESR